MPRTTSQQRTNGTHQNTSSTQDNGYNDPTEDSVYTLLTNQISWGAVFAGAFIALSAHVVLNMLGLGIGAATIDPNEPGGSPDVSSITFGTALWWTAAGIIASFVGGYAASRLSGKISPSTGGWHGLTTWAFTIIFMFYLMTTAIGSIAGGAYTIVSDGLSGAANLAGTAVEETSETARNLSENQNGVNSENWNRLQSQIESRLDQATGDLQAQDIRQAVFNVVNALVSQNRSAVNEASNQAVTLISESQNISREQAQERLNAYLRQVEQTYAEVVGETRQTGTEITETAANYADTLANNISQAAWYSFFALLLGALAAYAGGVSGTRREHAESQKTA